MGGNDAGRVHELRRVGLFGASSLGRQCLAQLRTHGSEAVATCFFDNDPKKWGTALEAVPVREPSPAALQAVDVIWLSTLYADQVQAQLEKLGVTTRRAFTLAEVLGTAAPADGGTRSVPGFRSDGCWPRVNVVMADEGWILERCAREIEKRLPYVRATRHADPAAAINYYMNYAAYRGGVGGHQAGFFTHVEERAPGMPERFFRVARAMDASVAMCERYAVQLRDAGVGSVRVITPGIDLERFTPRVRIGVVGRTYQTGRKGEDLVRAVMDEPGVEWVFTGEGWPAPARMYSDAEMPDFYRSLDYLLVPAYYEGGPMPVLEALACGLEVIAPRVGFVDDYPHIEYAVGDAGDLRRVLRGVVETRMARRRSVESRSWDAWAEAHDQLFKNMIQTPSKVARASVPEPSIDFAGRRLRVLFALHAPESVTPVGGPSIRLPRTQKALAECGVDVDISREELPDPRGYDLVHVFNISERRAALRQLQHLRTFDVPIVFSPICLKVQEGYWAQRAVLPLFQQDLSDAELGEALARVAATPRELRDATGMAIDPHWGGKIREITALADHLVMLSEREMTVLDEIGAISSPFSLVHNGVDPTWADGATGDLFKDRYGLGDYILSVGRLEPRKNQLMVARALRDTDIDLVCLGAPHQAEYVELVRKHGNRVHLVGKLGHEDPLFRSAYAGARAFVLPSWSEGAPLSALEAFSFGLPMVLSDRSSEPEYFGPLARYCDPLDLEGLRSALLEAFAEPVDSPLRAARRRLVETSLTWSHTARETAQAYVKVLREKRPERALPGGFTPPQPRRLEIGSGMTPQRGYEHLDARPDLPDIDHVADIRHALPFPSGTFDEVMSRSCIEHVSWREVRQVLTEWGRILKPGGVLDVWTPDFEYLCRQYIARKDDRHLDPALAGEAQRAFGGYDPSAWAIIKMFGGQDYPENFHGTVMDEDVLTRVLRASGFDEVKRLAPFTGLRLIARRAAAFEKPDEASHGRTAVPGTWAGAEAPALVWEGPAFGGGRHAAIARQVLTALVPAGLPVDLRPQDLDDPRRTHYLDSPRDGWLWNRTLGRTLKGCALISCGSAAHGAVSGLSEVRSTHAGMRAYIGLVITDEDRPAEGWQAASEPLDQIWVPSGYDRDALLRAGVPGSKLHVVPLGIDAARLDASTITPLEVVGRHGFTFLAVLDGAEGDGLDVLLRAYTTAFSSTDDVTLVLRAETPGLEEHLMRLTAEMLASLGHRQPLPTVVVSTESMTDNGMVRLLRTADAVVSPSQTGRWRAALGQAMALGKPVVAPRFGAALDIAGDETAFLVDTLGTVPLDDVRQWAIPSVDHLARVLRSLADDPTRARAVGAAARAAVLASWTPERTAAWTAARLSELAPDPSLAMTRGRRAEAAGNLDEAARQYARAAQLKPGWLLPVYNRASVLRRQRQRKAAAPLFERVARGADTVELRGGAWFHLGEIAFEEGRTSDAQAAFAACLHERPDHSRSRAWLALIDARAHEQHGRLDAARDRYRDALTAAGAWPLAAYGLASALKRLGELGEAQLLFGDVARTADQASLRGGAQFHLGDLLAASGRTDEAIGRFESCLTEMPEHAAAAARLSELRMTTLPA